MTSSSEANSLNTVKQTKLLRWKSVVAVQQHTKDGVTNSFPILSDQSNRKDVFLAYHLRFDRPFDAPRGKSTSAWNSTAHYLSKAVNPYGKFVFPLGCNSRQLKARFNELIAIMKKMESEVPRRSDCNNEEDVEEFQLLLEELLELTLAAVSNATASKSNAISAAARTLAEDRINADVHRRSSVDMVSNYELCDLRSKWKEKEKDSNS
jgi:hypothetical protein